jgi:hypothetical protein
LGYLLELYELSTTRVLEMLQEMVAQVMRY